MQIASNTLCHTCQHIPSLSIHHPSTPPPLSQPLLVSLSPLSQQEGGAPRGASATLHLIASFIEHWINAEGKTMARGGAPFKPLTKSSLTFLQSVVIIGNNSDNLSRTHNMDSLLSLLIFQPGYLPLANLLVFYC